MPSREPVVPIGYPVCTRTITTAWTSFDLSRLASRRLRDETGHERGAEVSRPRLVPGA